MNFYILTLFPQMIIESLSHSILGRAEKNGFIKVNCIDIRDFSNNKHKTVDDYPFGGGSGMVLNPEPVYNAFLHTKSLIEGEFLTVYLTPHGKTYDQTIAKSFKSYKNIILLCGHYEGIDNRAIELINPLEISLGDFIITGGELGALIIVDSVSRLVSGVLGKENSYVDESFENNLLEYPQYTRPREFMGLSVPDILLSGHHSKIHSWRREQALKITKTKRPDLLYNKEL